MTLHDEILIECLAGVMALYGPIRDVDAPFWGATSVLRSRHGDEGLRWHAQGDKARERELTTLVRQGLMTRRRANRVTIAVKLSDSGLIEAWKLIGISPDRALETARWVNELGPGQRRVPEIAFLGKRKWGGIPPEELKGLEAWLAPSRVKGWTESNCDTHGRVAYRLTALGVQALQDAGKGPSDDGDSHQAEELPEPAPEVWEVYHKAYAESLSWLNSLDAERVGARGEIGELPLSQAEWAGWVSS
jgi:hypothetical protein